MSLVCGNIFCGLISLVRFVGTRHAHMAHDSCTFQDGGFTHVPSLRAEPKSD